jgi:hypothetical protein
MLKNLELRQLAMDQLGDRFDIKEFHNLMLTSGGVPLEISERIVIDFINAILNQGLPLEISERIVIDFINAILNQG